jgi:hypothetical protein
MGSSNASLSAIASSAGIGGGGGTTSSYVSTINGFITNDGVLASPLNYTLIAPKLMVIRGTVPLSSVVSVYNYITISLPTGYTVSTSGAAKIFVGTGVRDGGPITNTVPYSKILNFYASQNDASLHVAFAESGSGQGPLDQLGGNALFSGDAPIFYINVIVPIN